jgi:CRISPR-associated protein Cas1
MSLDLTVMEPGYSLGRAGDVLELRKGGDTLDRIPLHRVRSLAMGPGVGVSSDLLVALADHGAIVLVQDRQERTGAVLFGPRAFGAAALRRAQCRAAVGADGLWVAQSLIGAKLLHQARLLRLFGQAMGASRAKLDLAGLAMDIHGLAGQVRAMADRPALLALEAHGARLHWRGVGLMVPLRERVHPHADDLVNQLLNYGYAALGRAWMQVALQAGLDPHQGVLHGDRVGRPSLVLDLMEPWRPWVDRTVVGLLRQGVKLESCQGLLTGETRHRLLGALDRCFQARPPKQKLPLRALWLRNTRQLARHLVGGEPWFPFITHP